MSHTCLNTIICYLLINLTIIYNYNYDLRIIAIA